MKNLEPLEVEKSKNDLVFKLKDCEKIIFTLESAIKVHEMELAGILPSNEYKIHLEFVVETKKSELENRKNEKSQLESDLRNLEEEILKINEEEKLNSKKLMEEEYQQIVESLKKGELVFFLGSDINLCDRPLAKNGEPKTWHPDDQSKYPPTDFEIAQFLARKYGSSLKELIEGESVCPNCNSTGVPDQCPFKNLQFVSQCIHDIFGEYNLYNELIQLFKNHVYASNQVHQNLIEICKFITNYNLEIRDTTVDCPLIISTIYDSTLEQEFSRQGQRFDLISYIEKGKERGKYQHHTPCEKYPPEEKGFPIPNQNYRKAPEGLYHKHVLLKEHPLILKLCNGVFTEDQFEQLIFERVSDQLPNRVRMKLSNNILFLGYPLKTRKSLTILNLFFKGIQRNKWRVIQQACDKGEQKKWSLEDQSSFIFKSPSEFIVQLKQYLVNKY